MECCTRNNSSTIYFPVYDQTFVVVGGRLFVGTLGTRYLTQIIQQPGFKKSILHLPGHEQAFLIKGHCAGIVTLFPGNSPPELE
jgi:hypothetical protein